MGFLLIFGCAHVPGGGTAGAVRLSVVLRLAGPVNDNYQYFFLIRNAGEEVPHNGPIPIIQPPYLNGFATGQFNDTTQPDYAAGFTDFVEYSRVQRQVTASGYTVYHLPGGIKGDPNRDIFVTRGEPDFAVSPAGGSILRFELAVNRLTPDVGSGELDPSNGTNRFLQINVVATTTTPHSPTTIDPSKFLDAFGEQRIGSGTFNDFITIDTNQIGRTYQSDNISGSPFFEPDNDTFPGPSDPGVELVAWSIQILGR